MKAALERTSVETKRNECFLKNIYASQIQITLWGWWVMESKKIIGLNREPPWEMGKAHTLHHPPQSDVPQAPGWPAEEEPPLVRGMLSCPQQNKKKRKVKQKRQLMQRIACMWASDLSASVCHNEQADSSGSMYPTIRAERTALRGRSAVKLPGQTKHRKNILN